MIEIVNESGATADELALEDVARFTLGQMEIHPLAELSILLVDEDAMTELHVKWMDEPGPTDVLSFPMDELRPPGLSGATASASAGRPTADDRDPEPDLLGDVVLCPSVAAAQAKQAGHSTQAELELLCVHGILHLLGYDHADPEEEAEMFGLQAELLRDWRADRTVAAADVPGDAAGVPGDAPGVRGDAGVTADAAENAGESRAGGREEGREGSG